jgi:hypothetical protein
MSETDQWLAAKLMSGTVSILQASTISTCRVRCPLCPSAGHHWCRVPFDPPPVGFAPVDSVNLYCRHCPAKMLASPTDPNLPMV